MRSPITRRSSAPDSSRRPALVVGAALLLVLSLFVDVGVARAEYPAGWEDPDLMDIGACIGYCGTAWISKSAFAKYSFTASCIGCIWKFFGALNSWAETVDSQCYTGILGQPCTGVSESR